jgi:hypothetical protein
VSANRTPASTVAAPTATASSNARVRTDLPNRRLRRPVRGPGAEFAGPA